MTCQQYKSFAANIKSGQTTAASLDWLRCMIYYNNLHRFTRVLCVVGLFPKLNDATAKSFDPALCNIKASLSGNVQATKVAKGELTSLSRNVLKLERQQIGIYIRKIHIQESLHQKSLLLPLLVHSWASFIQRYVEGGNVWRAGYVVKVSPIRGVAKRALPCLETNPGTSKTRAPRGYYSLCPGHEDDSPTLLFEFLPYVLMNGDINNLDKSDRVWMKAVMFKRDQASKESEGKQPKLLLYVSRTNTTTSPESNKKKGKRGKQKDDDTPDKSDKNVTSTSPESNKKKGKGGKQKDDDSPDKSDTNDVPSKKMTVDDLDEQGMRLFANLDNIEKILPEKDWVQPTTEWKWDGEKGAPIEDIMAKLHDDMLLRRQYLTLYYLKNDLIAQPYYWFTIESELFRDKHQPLMSTILMTDFGNVIGAEEDIKVVYKEAVKKYKLESLSDKEKYQLTEWYYKDASFDSTNEVVDKQSKQTSPTAIPEVNKGAKVTKPTEEPATTTNVENTEQPKQTTTTTTTSTTTSEVNNVVGGTKPTEESKASMNVENAEQPKQTSTRVKGSGEAAEVTPIGEGTGSLKTSQVTTKTKGKKRSNASQSTTSSNAKKQNTGALFGKYGNLTILIYCDFFLADSHV